jgi:glycosyltransferase involved in cell wall biosynthesis
MNWIHRQRKTGWRHFLRAEYGNLVLSLIRSRLADHIVYQSEFARGWWERVYGAAPARHSVVHNGVDLNVYTPIGAEQPPEDCYRVLMVEGSVMGGYETGLEVGIKLVARLAERVLAAYSRDELQAIPVELMVVGRVPPELQKTWSAGAKTPLRWAGIVAGDQIPAIDRSAHLLYSADINAACPNSVIEALACGLPVLSFDTGALPELVSGGAGRVVPYSADPWRLEQPSVETLAEAALGILEDQGSYRQAARQRAEQFFGLDKMVDGYLQALFED